jgi:sporulation protein YlmC with PRC-barrel domain
MTTVTQFVLGDNASCDGRSCGVVRRLIVDPVAETVTHLVIDPKHGKKPGRVVPLDIVEATPQGLELRCSLAAFEDLPAAEETEFLPPEDGYTSEQALTWPYYSHGTGVSSAGAGLGSEKVFQAVTHDRVPLGEVAVRRGDHVRATDGDIGSVQGLVLDRASHQVTHVLLREGHLWGRKEVSIPIRAVTATDSVVHVKLSRTEIGDLPSVDIDYRNKLTSEGTDPAEAPS